MKKIEKIKKAYFDLMQQAGREYEQQGKMNEKTRHRLVNGYAWINENGILNDIWSFAEENGFDYFMESIRKESEGISESNERKSLREMHGSYCEVMDIRYNQQTRQYENI